jgi:antitoxin component HigA of HigAB toxin-antitoxin module
MGRIRKLKITPVLNKSSDVEKLTCILSEHDYDRAIPFVDKQIFKSSPTAEEEKSLEMLLSLIEKYEAENYPILDGEKSSANNYEAK